jgi:hypothetical protein
VHSKIANFGHQDHYRFGWFRSSPVALLPLAVYKATPTFPSHITPLHRSTPPGCPCGGRISSPKFRRPPRRLVEFSGYRGIQAQILLPSLLSSSCASYWCLRLIQFVAGGPCTWHQCRCRCPPPSPGVSTEESEYVIIWSVFILRRRTRRRSYSPQPRTTSTTGEVSLVSCDLVSAILVFTFVAFSLGQFWTYIVYSVYS